MNMVFLKKPLLFSIREHNVAHFVFLTNDQAFLTSLRKIVDKEIIFS